MGGERVGGVYFGRRQAVEEGEGSGGEHPGAVILCSHRYYMSLASSVILEKGNYYIYVASRT